MWSTIDPEGFVQIVDRTKDLVKSGGEWISSQDLENAIMAHPKVLEAAVIAVPHPKWQERPLALVVPKPDFKDSLTKEEIYDYLRPRFRRCTCPTTSSSSTPCPRRASASLTRSVLRDEYKEYQLPDA